MKVGVFPFIRSIFLIVLKVYRYINAAESGVAITGMAAVPVQGTPALSLRNGCRCVPEHAVTVEELLVVVGENVGFDNILSAPRMNKAIVVFLKNEALIKKLIVSGIWLNETYVPVTLLSSSVTKITISNVPPFISSDAIIKELIRFRNIASPIRMISLGCKNVELGRENSGSFFSHLSRQQLLHGVR